MIVVVIHKKKKDMIVDGCLVATSKCYFQAVFGLSFALYLHLFFYPAMIFQGHRTELYKRNGRVEVLQFKVTFPES